MARRNWVHSPQQVIPVKGGQMALKPRPLESKVHKDRGDQVELESV